MKPGQNLRKKEREEIYCRRFVSLTGWDPSGLSSDESPDFLMRMDGLSVGIEVTELLRNVGLSGSSVKRGESQRARLIRKLADGYYAEGGRSARVQALWSGADHLALSSNITEQLVTERETLADWEIARVERGSGEIYYLTALPTVVGDYKRWSCVSDSVGSPVAIAAEELAACIHAKSEKLLAYRGKAERTLLLIVADQLTNAGRGRLSPSFEPIEGKGFDEVHLLMYPDTTQRIDREPAF
jgi:hypothetical protein